MYNPLSPCLKCPLYILAIHTSSTFYSGHFLKASFKFYHKKNQKKKNDPCKKRVKKRKKSYNFPVRNWVFNSTENDFFSSPKNRFFLNFPSFSVHYVRNLAKTSLREEKSASMFSLTFLSFRNHSYTTCCKYRMGWKKGRLLRYRI